MLDPTEMNGAIEHTVNRLRQEREQIEDAYYTLGEKNGVYWCLDATYCQILRVVSWDLNPSDEDEFIKLLEKQDPIKLEGGIEHIDLNSDFLLSRFGDKYIYGFVTSVKDFWRNNKHKIS
jgi:hypothetical protein